MAKSRRDSIIAAVWDQCGGRPQPFTGPVMVQGHFHPARNRNGKIPDADAFTKHLLDCLSKAGVYLDDNQVVMSPPLERMEPKAKGLMHIEVWEV
jgi:Holliday junction resolvase RusA-like endonuclease